MEEKLIGIECYIEDTKKQYDFARYKTICAFGDDIKNGVITMDKANDEQSKFTQKIREFKSNSKRQTNVSKK